MQIKTKIVSSHTADSKPVKQEVNSTVILPPLVLPGQSLADRTKPGEFSTLEVVVCVLWACALMLSVIYAKCHYAECHK